MRNITQPAPKTWIVVPCYDEAKRLPLGEFASFASKHEDVAFIMVDDGSSDGTLDLLRDLEVRAPHSFIVLALQRNRGKAEAVRRGMNKAFARGAHYAGYWDSDLATPLEAILDFVTILERSPHVEVLFGSRVKLLGHTIKRRATRHYLGRVYATAVSITLDLGVYDTQCGAKLFRASPENKALFERPFLTTWVFDVEIIARMIEARRGTGRPGPAQIIQEVPLAVWHDVTGSKVKPVDFLRSMLELYRVWRRYLRAGRRV